MALRNPFNVDAAILPAEELARLPAQGGMAIRAFCGLDDSAPDWDTRGICVLKARKGFGKSHLLAVRSLHHRDGAADTLFYPRSERKGLLIETLSTLNVVVPRWLHGKESIAVWIQVWQLSILGLMVWLVDARSDKLPAYAEWFGSTDPPGLQGFMDRILKRMPADDFNQGAELLRQGLFHANSDWAVAIGAGLARLKRSRVALYLDSPDELVGLDQPGVWRNIQQGLLLAIWKFAKNSGLSRMLSIYASVRSEAFGTGEDHADIDKAMGLVLTLRYSRDDLEAMMNDRIAQAEPARLMLALKDCSKPIQALCGFARVTHHNRFDLAGGSYSEDVFDSILRHTRMIPREVIGMGGAIYEKDVISGARNFDAVRDAVNRQARLDISLAIGSSFLGWKGVDHARFAVMLSSEVIDAAAMAELVVRFDAESDKHKQAGSDGASIIKYFLRHGLLGLAEQMPQRHRHYYRQRFAFDEAEGTEDSGSLNKEYFFVHPGFKEWLLNLPGQLARNFPRLKFGVVGNQQPFEPKAPLIRLCMQEDRFTLLFSTGEPLATSERGRSADALKFLCVVLSTCRELRKTRVLLSDIRRVLPRIKGMRRVKIVLEDRSIRRIDAIEAKMRDWGAKANGHPLIRDAQHLLIDPAEQPNVKEPPVPPFISVSARSELGEEIEVHLTRLPLDELDWDEASYASLSTASHYAQSARYAASERCSALSRKAGGSRKNASAGKVRARFRAEDQSAVRSGVLPTQGRIQEL